MTALYPEVCYRQLYRRGEPLLWSADRGLPPEEDGDHYQNTPDFFEWWYFDAAFDNGCFLVAIFHSSLFNAADHKPTLDLRIYTPEGERILDIRRYPRQAFSARRDRCQLQLGPCRVAEEGGRYRLSIRGGEIQAELAFTPQVPGWRPGTGFLFRDEMRGHFFRWAVPLPRAAVTGTLGLAGSSFPVQGVGYHDHNWGNLFLPTAFDRWYWGRLFADEFTVVYGDVIGRGENPPQVTPFMLARGASILMDTDQVQWTPQDVRREGTTGAEYPAQMSLRAQTDAGRARIVLRTRRVMEAVTFPRPLFRRPRWLRQMSEVAFFLTEGKPPLSGLVRPFVGRSSYLRLEVDYEMEFEGGNEQVHRRGETMYEMMVL